MCGLGLGTWSSPGSRVLGLGQQWRSPAPAPPLPRPPPPPLPSSAAIECFKDAGAVVVPRSRFAPVKTCSDLFALRSDAYRVTEASTVVLAAPQPPLIKLDDKYYK